jgi:hypothetical protein
MPRHPPAVSGARAPGGLSPASQQLVDLLLEGCRIKPGLCHADNPLPVDDQVGGEAGYAVLLGDFVAGVQQDRVSEAVVIPELMGVLGLIAMLTRIDAQDDDAAAAVLLPDLLL